MDKLTKEERSWNMSRVKGVNTKPEVNLRRLLFTSGIRYRIKNRVFGKPDILINKDKIAIFVDGCFWHRHEGCKLSYSPKSNKAFWVRKFEANQKRDEKVNKTLKSEGWNVIRIWECQIEDDLDKTARTVINEIKQYGKN